MFSVAVRLVAKRDKREGGQKRSRKRKGQALIYDRHLKRRHTRCDFHAHTPPFPQGVATPVVTLTPRPSPEHTHTTGLVMDPARRCPLVLGEAAPTAGPVTTLSSGNRRVLASLGLRN